MNEQEELEDVEHLKRVVLREPKSRSQRAQVIELVTLLVGRAKRLANDHLLGAEGHVIAMDVCGILAFVSSDDVVGEKWLDIDREPGLYEIMQVSGKLDIDAQDLSSWQHLFQLVSGLK